MKQISVDTSATHINPAKGDMPVAGSHSSKGELVVKGVATALAAATIIETGKGVMSTLVKQPIVMFGMGVAAGYFTHKYRKEIISIASKTAEQGKDFILQQKEHIKDLLAETREGAE